MGVYDHDTDDDSTDFVDTICLNMEEIMRGREFAPPTEYPSWLQYFTANLSFRLILEDYDNGKQSCTDALTCSSEVLSVL